MPKHLITLPHGTALPSPTGLPEGYPFRLDPAGELYSIKAGVFVAVTGGGGATVQPRLEVSGGHFKPHLANNTAVAGFVPSSVTQSEDHTAYVGAGQFSNLDGAGPYAVHFFASITGIDAADTAARLTVDFGDYVQDFPVRGTTITARMDFVLPSPTSIVPTLTAHTSGASDAVLDDWRMVVTPLVVEAASPVVAPAVVAPANTTAFGAPSGDLTVSWTLPTGAVVGDAISVLLEQANTAGVITVTDTSAAPYSTTATGTQTSLTLHSIPAGDYLVLVQRVTSDPVARPTHPNVMGLVTIV